jgi:hypothetical protein
MLEFQVNETVDGIAKDGAKSVLYYSSVALGCDFYPQIKLTIGMARQMEPRRDGQIYRLNFSSCAAPPLVPWIESGPFIHYGSFSSDIEPYPLKKDKDSHGGGVRLWRRL